KPEAESPLVDQPLAIFEMLGETPDNHAMRRCRYLVDELVDCGQLLAKEVAVGEDISRQRSAAAERAHPLELDQPPVSGFHRRWRGVERQTHHCAPGSTSRHPHLSVFRRSGRARAEQA